MPYYTKRNGRKRRVYEKNGKYFVYERVPEFVTRAEITEEDVRRRSPPKRIGILENQIRELEEELASNISVCANQYQADLQRRGVDANTIREQARLIDQQRRAASELDQLRGQVATQTRDHQQLIAQKEQELAQCIERSQSANADIRDRYTQQQQLIRSELDQLRAHLVDREQYHQTLITSKDAELERIRAEFQHHISTIDPAIIRDHEARLAAQTADCRGRIDALRAEFTAQQVTQGAQYDHSVEEKQDRINELEEDVSELTASVAQKDLLINGTYKAHIRDLEQQVATFANQYQQSLQRHGVDAATINQQAQLIAQQKTVSDELNQLRGLMRARTRDHQLLIAQKERELQNATSGGEDRIAAQLEALRAATVDKEAQYHALIEQKDAELARYREEFHEHMLTMDPNIIREHEERLAAQTTDCQARLNAIRAEFELYIVSDTNNVDHLSDEISLLNRQISDLRQNVLDRDGRISQLQTDLARAQERDRLHAGMSDARQDEGQEALNARQEEIDALREELNAHTARCEERILELQTDNERKDARILEANAALRDIVAVANTHPDIVARLVDEHDSRMEELNRKYDDLYKFALNLDKGLQQEVAEYYAETVSSSAEIKRLRAVNEELLRNMSRLSVVTGSNRELIQHLDNSLAAMAVARQNLEGNAARLDTAAQGNAQSIETVRDLRAAAANMEEISEQAEESVRNMRETNDRYDDELQQCKDRTEVYLQRLHESDAAVENCNARRKYYEAESSRLRELNENLADDNERLYQQYTSLEIRCADMRRDFDAFRAEIAIQGPAARDEYAREPFSTTQINDEVNAELEEKVHNLEARNTQLSASNARLLSENEAAAADIEQIQPILRECSEDKRELEQRREMTNEMVDELKAKEKELRILSYKLQCISTKPRGRELLTECEQGDELIE